MQTVRYCYALDESNRLVSIKEAKETNNTFVCPCCNSEMTKRCGQFRAWHFAHKKKQCDYDNYLHTVAEQKIMEWFNKSEKVMIDIESFSKCPNLDQCKWHQEEEEEGYSRCRNLITQNYDLKRWFSHAELEKSYTKNGERFVADIFCHNRKPNGQPLFIEICVTHSCEPKKIESGIKIIEFKIKSEADIDAIINSPIRKSEHTHFYNFQPKGAIGEIEDFGIPLQIFVLRPSMKAFLDRSLSCHEVGLHRGIFEITIDYNDSFPYFLNDGGFYAVAMAVASQYFRFNSCALCKYQVYNDWENTNICTLYKKYGTKKYCRDNNAAECSFFRRNEELIKQRIEAFNKYKEKNHVDIWLEEELQFINHQNIPKLISPQECFSCPIYRPRCGHCLGAKIRNGRRYVVCDWKKPE